MAEQSKQLYHCDRCGEVFRSKIKAKSELQCTQCGLHPIRDGFAQLAQMPALDHASLDSNHGIAGKDEADFFSMQRKRKQKRAMMMYLIWFVLLISALGIGYYVKKIQDDKEIEIDAINKDDNDYRDRQKKAQNDCLRRFQRFTLSSNENAQANHIYNGTNYLVGIKRYYANPLNAQIYKGGKKSIRLHSSKLVEEEGKPSRLNMLIKIDHDERIDQLIEAVFWKKDDKWLMDWPQFVRFGEVNWTNFIKNKEITGDYEFRLYARKRNTAFDDFGDYQELVFSKPINIDDEVSTDSTPVYVKKKTKLAEQILDRIQYISKRNLSDKDILGSFDTLGQARVRVSIGYEEIEGKKLLVLKELYAKDWFSILDEAVVEDAKK